MHEEQAGGEPSLEELVADVFSRRCSSREVLEHVTGKWAVLALAALDDGPRRFGELRRRVDGVSEKMLSQTLQLLERDGLRAEYAHEVRELVRTGFLTPAP